MAKLSHSSLHGDVEKLREFVKTCPKCNGEMIEGRRLVAYGGVTFAKKGDWFGDKIIPYYCRNCGYIELYKKRRNKP